MFRLSVIFTPLLLLSLCGLSTSCTEQYNIAGNSSVPCLDGRMLYLRVNPDSCFRETAITSVCVDSCKVVHGRFSFEGNVDSATMAMLYTGTDCVMPLVLENGNLNIQVDNVVQRVSGGPLNEMWELQQKTIRMMREGSSPEDIQRKVGKKAEKLMNQTEELETQFVQDNYDNVLGPGFFMLLCSQYPTPIMTRQISRIVDRAPDNFMRHPFVRRYVHEARSRVSAKKQDEE